MLQQQFQSCIDACQACATACDFCASQCLKEYDVSSMARCIALDVDCADACRLAATVMARGSTFAVDVCALCADICEACADECSRHAMAHCQDCAQACKRCAVECRSMQSTQPGRQADRDIGTVPH
jgi:hypothetical protein